MYLLSGETEKLFVAKAADAQFRLSLAHFWIHL